MCVSVIHGGRFVQSATDASSVCLFPGFQSLFFVVLF